MSEKVLRCFKVSTLIGCLLMNCPNAVTWYWGNMSVYVLSYMRIRGVTSGSTVETPWIISLTMMSWSAALLYASFIARFLGRRPTLLLGLAIADGGLAASYVSVQYSINSLNFTQGVMCGTGQGLAYSMMMLYAIDLTKQHTGVFTAALSVAVNIGGAVINPIISLYVNPRNRSPDIHLGPSSFFSEVGVIDRVPSLYLLLLGISGSFHLVGFCLIRDISTKPIDTNKHKENKAPMINDEAKSKQNRGPDHIDSGKDQIETTGCQHKESNRLLTNTNTSCDNNYTPKKVLRTRVFYALWLILFIDDTGFLAQGNFYKTFGERYIQSDHSLANLGTVLVITVAVCRLLGGMLVDRACIKTVMVSFLSAVTILFSFYYFTPIFNPWPYYVCSVLLGAFDSVLYSNFAVITLKVFGPEHFSINFGLVMSSTMLLNLVSPPIFRLVLQNWGWFVFYFSIAAFNCLGLLLAVLLLPVL